MRIVRLAAIGTFLVIMAWAVPAHAQFDSATIVGTVRDASKSVVPGAKVTLTAVDTAITVVRLSGSDGNYEFPAVKPGQYVVTAEKAGFALALVDNIQAQVGARLTTGVKLGGSSLTTGNTPREGAFNVNGLRSVFNNFLIDGVDNNAYGTSNQGFSNQVMQPTPDAIGEFKVVTNNMSAEYGRAAGATVNVSYRSGTNSLQGSAWEFLREDSLNATGFFKPAAGKPAIDRNQFGGLLGGPIVRNKAFFFADYEGQRQTRAVTGVASIATPTQRQGIFSVDIRDPRTGILYPAGTQIPVTAFARKVLSALPDTTSGGNTNNYTKLQEFTADYDKANGKVDLQMSPTVSLFGRYGFRNLDTFDESVIPLPAGGSGNGAIYAKNRQAVLGTTWTPSGRSLLEVRFGYSWTQAGKNPPALGTDSALQQFGLPGLPDDPRISGGLPTIVITGYAD